MFTNTKGGNLGIGTTNPGTLLDVNGSMNAQNFAQPTFTNQQYTTITTATSMAGTALGSAGGITISKTASGTNTWDACAYSNQSYKYGAYCSARAAQTTAYVMWGLSANQTATNLSTVAYASINYAWFFVADQTLQIYENGTYIATYGTYNVTTSCSITFDGSNIIYWKDGVAVRTVSRAVGSPLFFMCTPYQSGGATIYDVVFGPSVNTNNPGQVITASTGMFSNTVYACKTGASASGAENPGAHAIMAVAPDGASVNASIWMGFDPTNDCGYINSARYGLIRPVCLQTRGGNVGIGITNPACQLQLYSSGTGGQIGIGMQNDATPYMRIGMDTAYIQYICNNAYWTGSAYNYVNTGGYSGTASAILQVSGYIDFCTVSGGTNPIAWNSRMRVANSGNVGINQTSPAYTLDVNGTLNVSGDSHKGGVVYMDGTKNTSRGIEWYYGANDRYGMCQDTNGATRIFTSTAYGAATVRLCGVTGTSAGNFNDYLVVTASNGFVGIGTASPGYTLHVNGNDYASGGRYTSDWFRVNSDGTGLYSQYRNHGVCIDGATYCNISTYGGGNNGWQGYACTTGSTNNLMFSGNTGGIYMNNQGWVMYNDGANTDIRYAGTAKGQAVSYGWATFGLLTCNGDIQAYYSDERLKEDFQPITNAIDKLKTLDTFTYVSNGLARSFDCYKDDTERHVGVSAQQIQKVLPEVVKIAPFDIEVKDEKITSKSGQNYLTVQYDKLVPFIMAALKEEIQKREALEEKLEKLLNKL